MSEQQGEDLGQKQPETRTSRRGFLGRATAVIGSGSAGLAIMSARELPVPENGLNTPNATFYPIYEIHGQDMELKDIPTDVDGFFFETGGAENTGALYALTWLVTDMGYSNSVLNRKILNSLDPARTRVILGDVDIGKKRIIESVIEYPKKRILLAGVLAIIGIGKSLNPSKLDRRNFIKKAAYIGAAVVGVPLLMDQLTEVFLGKEINQKNALQRILIRANGLLTHASPENLLVFFRNLIMADKLLTVAEKFHQELGRKPKITFNMGAAHSGVEDFLLMGLDFTRWLISQYPREFLEEIAKEQQAAGRDQSLEYLFSARVISLPTDYHFTKDSLSNVNLNPELRERLRASIKVEKVIDKPLLEMVVNKASQ